MNSNDHLSREGWGVKNLIFNLVAFSILTLIIFIINLSLIPAFAEMLDEMGSEISYFPQIVINASLWIRYHHGWILLLAVYGAVIGFIVWLWRNHQKFCQWFSLLMIVAALALLVLWLIAFFMISPKTPYYLA
jgi:type II secretory pathway component PulF